jgi:hypothetical protein
MTQHLGLLNSSCCFPTIDNHNTTAYENMRNVFLIAHCVYLHSTRGDLGDEAVVFVFTNYWPDKSWGSPTFTYSSMEVKFVGGMQMMPA